MSERVENTRSIMSGCSCSPAPPGQKSRNLVVNLDGTSNQYGSNNTNVIELFSRIAASNEQLKYYNSGIGTFARPSWRSWSYIKQVLENKVDLMIAWNFERVLIGAYRWLSDQYQEGDRIFLFGFSRGAYQVRALAGMIEKVGLIHKGNDEQIPFAYELYADLHGQEDESAAAHFKKTFSAKGAHVHFVGVWDTVSSIGLVRGTGLPLTDSCDHVCYFRHALALDECRVKFMPECIVKKGQPVPPNAKEVWFAGSHSDVGGGTMSNDQLNLESVPLLWMENEALMAGLHLQQSSVDWNIGDLETSTPHESLSGVWWLLEYLPIRREYFSDPDLMTWAPHLGESRFILPGQKIHASVAFKAKDYTPKAIFLDNETVPRRWKDVVGQGPSGKFRKASGWSDILELDLFDLSVASDLLTRLGEDTITKEDQVHILNRLFFLRSLPELSDTARALILEHMPVVELVSMLKTADCEAAAHTLAFLANNDDVRVQIIEANVITILVGMLTGNKSHSSALVLRTLMKYADTRVLIIGLDAIPVLVGMLKTDGCAAAAAILASLEGDESLAFAESNAIPMLVRMGKAGKWKVAAEALAWLAHNADARAHMVQANTIPALVKALKGTDGTKYAADALARLAEHDANHRALVARSNAVPVLVKMLESGTHSRSAVEALRWLASDVDAQRQMIRANAIPPLIEALKNPDGRKQAASTLAWLAYENLDTRAQIIRSDAIPPLINMLESTDDAPAAVEALKCLIWSDDGRAQVVQGNAIPSLIQALEDSEGRKHAAYALAGLAENNTSHRTQIASHPDAVPFLVNMLESTSDSIAAVEVLRWLAPNVTARGQMVQGNTISALVQVLKTARGRGNAASTLAWLAYEDPNARAQIIRCDAIPTLINMLESADDSPQAIEVLKSLSCNIDGRSQIMQANAIPAFVHALRDVAARKHAADVLTNLARHNNNYQDQIIAATPIPILVKIMKDTFHSPSAIKALRWLASNVDAQAQLVLADGIPTIIQKLAGAESEDAAGALGALAENEDARALMVKHNAVPKLVHMLGGPNHEDASSALIQLAKHEDSRASVIRSEVIATLVKTVGNGAMKLKATVTLKALAGYGVFAPTSPLIASTLVASPGNREEPDEDGSDIEWEDAPDEM